MGEECSTRHIPISSRNDAMNLLTCADAARAVTEFGPPITPNGIRMAAERGQLAVAMRTRSGIRLFAADDVLRYARERATKRAKGALRP